MEVEELEIAHLELRYAHTRIMKRGSLISLAASIEQYGQISPVIIVAPRVLIDGYRRVAALKLCKRDTVLAEAWSRGEDQALLRMLATGCERRWEAMEQAALIRELITRHEMSQARVARMLGHDPSWVARRLSLLEVLSEEVLEKIRSGRVSSWAASRVLAPLARANADHAAALARWISQEHVSTRDLASFFGHYQSANAIARERMVANPSLFMKALHAKREDKEAANLRDGPEGKWLSDLGLVASTLRRLSRLAAAVLYPGHKGCGGVLATLGEVADLVQTLDEQIRRQHDFTGVETGRSNPSSQGNEDSPDQPCPESVAQHHPQDPAWQGKGRTAPAVQVAGCLAPGCRDL